MEHETLFTTTKWEILKRLEQRPHSPLELAKGLNSSLANISQQLRLLEMAGLVKTQRIGNRDKDKPRVIYALAGNLSYLISTSDDFVDKKLLQLSDYNKAVLKIWFLEDQETRYALEKAFWQIEPELASIELLSYAGKEQGVPVLEFLGKQTLAGKIEVGGSMGAVLFRYAKIPSGHVLFSRRK